MHRDDTSLARHNPENPNIPYGYYACGCGQKTKIIERTEIKKGRIKGEPNRFVFGHQGKRYWLPIPDSESTHHVLVPLTRGKLARVDRSDLTAIRSFTWYAYPSGRTWYAYSHNDGNPVSMHRVITGASEGVEVDHIDGDGLNNSRDNLRVSTRSQNNQNRTFSNKKFKGVSASRKEGRWYSRIKVGGVTRCLGTFTAPDDAARAYDEAAREHFGEFATLNFPKNGERSAITGAILTLGESEVQP